ncbi:UDP-glycosyltransferase 72E1-like [Silene latifolia]|uniref:UDP-glycosyltransferase 72E1-like n=1 Tax=Silene latifolia TaxID=37657 RepID=UPI003D7878A1
MVNPSKPHIALLASPGLGHLIPIVELAKRLVAQHGFTVTVFAVTTGAHQAENKLLCSATSSCAGLFSTVALPNVVNDSLDIDPSAGILPRILAMVRCTLPTLRSSISDMKVKPVAIIVDQFGIEAVKVVAEEFNMLKYVFIASNAWFLAYLTYLPYLQKRVYPNTPLYIPGCKSIPGGDLLDHTFEPDSRAYRDFVSMGRDITRVDGIFINTWEDLEPETLGTFKDGMSLNSIVKVPVYPIGPVIRRPKEVAKNKLTEWLDDQLDESVIYVSFGSGGTLSTQQTIELAWGLELSKHRFIWVFRPPTENDSSASLFKSMDKADESISKCLPNGFLDRTRDRGIIVSKWINQEEILQHRSIGGFISHCGWNSVNESIVNGVPLIAWPLYAEQNMNATMLVEDLGIAIRPKVKPSKGLVRREEIEKMVKFVMDSEGFGLRKRVKDLQISANLALKEDGSSYSALSKVARDCNKKFQSNQPYEKCN